MVAGDRIYASSSTTPRIGGRGQELNGGAGGAPRIGRDYVGRGQEFNGRARGQGADFQSNGAVVVQGNTLCWACFEVGDHLEVHCPHNQLTRLGFGRGRARFRDFRGRARSPQGTNRTDFQADKGGPSSNPLNSQGSGKLSAKRIEEFASKLAVTATVDGTKSAHLLGNFRTKFARAWPEEPPIDSIAEQLGFGNVVECLKSFNERILVEDGPNGVIIRPGPKTLALHEFNLSIIDETRIKSRKRDRARNGRGIERGGGRARNDRGTERSRYQESQRGGATSPRNLITNCWSCGVQGHYQSRCPFASSRGQNAHRGVYKARDANKPKSSPAMRLYARIRRLVDSLDEADRKANTKATQTSPSKLAEASSSSSSEAKSSSSGESKSSSSESKSSSVDDESKSMGSSGAADESKSSESADDADEGESNVDNKTEDKHSKPAKITHGRDGGWNNGDQDAPKTAKRRLASEEFSKNMPGPSSAIHAFASSMYGYAPVYQPPAFYSSYVYPYGYAPFNNMAMQQLYNAPTNPFATSYPNFAHGNQNFY